MTKSKSIRSPCVTPLSTAGGGGIGPRSAVAPEAPGAPGVSTQPVYSSVPLVPSGTGSRFDEIEVPRTGRRGPKDRHVKGERNVCRVNRRGESEQTEREPGHSHGGATQCRDSAGAHLNVLLRRQRQTGFRGGSGAPTHTRGEISGRPRAEISEKFSARFKKSQNPSAAGDLGLVSTAERAEYARALCRSQRRDEAFRFSPADRPDKRSSRSDKPRCDKCPWALPARGTVGG